MILLWLRENIGTVVPGLLLCAAVAGIIRYSIWGRGSSSCAGNCGDCSGKNCHGRKEKADPVKEPKWDRGKATGRCHTAG
jgi:predicted CxxxxCH...CXXCH cytochrome family protein